jgi:hypothetical protein
MLPEAYANVELALTAYKQIADSFKPGDRGLRQLPVELPGPDQRRRVD